MSQENARAFSKTPKQREAIRLMSSHTEVLLEGG
jgi:hypothetical protein